MYIAAGQRLVPATVKLYIPMKYEPSPDLNISDQERSFRSFISNDPALSYFLETGSMRKNGRFSKEAIYKETAFLAFISPYFEDLYVNAVLRSFDLKDTNLMGDLASNPILLDDVHRKQAFDKILRFLEEKKAKLLSINSKLTLGGPVMTADLSEHAGIITICLLNYLPDDFQAFRTEYAKEIIKILHNLYNKDFQAALNIATDLRQLKCEAQTAYDADAFYKVLENASQRATATQGAAEGSSNPLSVIGFIIGAIVLIIKLILLFS
jgi:hypothetical protein